MLLETFYGLQHNKLNKHAFIDKHIKVNDYGKDDGIDTEDEYSINFRDEGFLFLVPEQELKILSDFININKNIEFLKERTFKHYIEFPKEGYDNNFKDYEITEIKITKMKEPDKNVEAPNTFIMGRITYPSSILIPPNGRLQTEGMKLPEKDVKASNFI